MEPVISLEPGKWIETLCSDGKDHEEVYDWEQVELMQYIGRTDQAGKKIYQKDIVTGICSDRPEHVCQGLQQSDMMGKQVTGIIEWSNTFAQFYFTTDGITYLAFPFGIREARVIGNVYENPGIMSANGSTGRSNPANRNKA